MSVGKGLTEEPPSHAARDRRVTGRCPILLVIGSRGIGSVARAADDLLRSHGLRVGLSLSESAFVNRERVSGHGASLARLHAHLLRRSDLNVLIVAASVRRALERPLGLKTITAASVWGNFENECRIRSVLAFADSFRAELVVTAGSRIAEVLARNFGRAKLALIGATPGVSAVEEHIGRGGSGLLCRWSKDGREPHSVEFYSKGCLVVRSSMPRLRFEESRHAEASLHAFALVQLALVADVQARTYH